MPDSSRRAEDPTVAQLKHDIDSGHTGDKVAFPDPGLSPLGTDDEAAGTPDTPDRIALARRQESRAGLGETEAPSPLRSRWLVLGLMGLVALVIVVGAVWASGR